MSDIKVLLIMTILIFLNFSCKDSNKRTNLPSPPKEPAKYEIRYNGKFYEFNNDEELKRFYDSLGIKDTIQVGID